MSQSNIKPQPHISHPILLIICTRHCICVLNSPSVVSNQQTKTLCFTNPQMEAFVGVRSNGHKDQTIGPQYPVS
jgi:hypothetical protein